jgi:hypothetical protein
VSIASGSTNLDRQATGLRSSAPLTSFSLRDLYVRTTVSGDSLAAELGRYLNIDEVTFSSSSKGDSRANHTVDAPTVHEQALAATLDVVISNSNIAFECVRVPEPDGGVREWWARMLSGSMNNCQSEPSGQEELEGFGSRERKGVGSWARLNPVLHD